MDSPPTTMDNQTEETALLGIIVVIAIALTFTVVALLLGRGG